MARRSYELRLTSRDLAYTFSLSAVEVGVYVGLLVQIRNRGFAFDEPDRLARGCNATKSRVSRVIETLIADGKLRRDGARLIEGPRA